MQKEAEKKNPPQIILASSSETRKNMLIKYVKSPILEKHRINEENFRKKNYKPHDLVCLLARKKAESIKDLYPTGIIIGSDQVLICQNRMINKPANIKEAKKNMLYLRNKVHTLISSIYSIKNQMFFFKETKTASLLFKDISEKQIDKYLQENSDTALSSVGSYKIEDNKRYNFVKIVNGDLETILGFPLKSFLTKVLANG